MATMERYLILPHTADGKFRAFGRTLEEAFSNSALAVASLMWNWQEIERRVSYAVDVRGRDPEQLLVRFLEEVLFLFDTRSFLLGEVEGTKISEGDGDRRLEAVLWGDNRPDEHEIFGEVKAITYNEMKIEKSCDRWSVQVVVDM